VADLQSACRSPRNAAPLLEQARDAESVVIVVGDDARPGPYAPLVEALVKTLIEEAELKLEQLTLLVACGPRRHVVGRRLVRLVGEWVAGQIDAGSHYALAHDQHDFAAHTPEAGPLRMDAAYVEADLRIVVAPALPNPLLGLTGCYELLCPGLLDRPALDALLAPARDGRTLLAPPRPADNLLQKRLIDAAQAAPEAFAVEYACRQDGRITAVAAGDVAAVHDAVLETAVAGWALPPAESPGHLVLVDGGGAPNDLLLETALTGAVTGAALAADDAPILLCARCEDGIGRRDVVDALAACSNADDLLRLAGAPDLDADTAALLRLLGLVLRRHRIVLTGSLLPPAVLASIGVQVRSDPQQALDDLLADTAGPIVHVPQTPFALPAASGAG
jgi:nickel-dependent lactate racemase